MPTKARADWDRKARTNLHRFLVELELAKSRPRYKAAATEQLIAEVERRIAELNDRLTKKLQVGRNP